MTSSHGHSSVIRCGHQQTVGLNPDHPFLLCENTPLEDVETFPDAPVCGGAGCGHECHSSS